MICDKCKKEFNGMEWKSGETYEGIDLHHNPPQFMMNKWEGKTYNLCRKCHRKLHDEIIKILNKFANTLKFIKSEYWVWNKIIPNKRQEIKDEIIKFSEVWINDSETTSKS